MIIVGDENVFVQDGKFIIKVILIDDKYILQNYIINFIDDGICIFIEFKYCVVVININNGNLSIVFFVKLGCINIKLGVVIKYGCVEVIVKFFEGDWFWFVIWMMFVKDIYGVWFVFGEIDIVESCGNNYIYL